MSNILDKYTELTPHDKRSVAAITRDLGQQFEQRGIDFESQDPEFAKYYNYLKEKRKPSLTKEFTKGFARGIDQTQSTYYGGAALVADALSWEGGREWAMEGFKRNEEEAAKNAATISSYKDVENVGDAIRYGIGLSGEVLPSAVESIGSGLASGGVGAPIAKQMAKRAIKKRIGKEVREDLTKKLVEKAAKKGFARAAALGTTASSMLQSSGEVYGELYDTAATREDRIKASLVAGSISGAVDSIVPVTVLRRIFPPSVVKDMAEDQIKKQGIDLITKNIDEAFAGYEPLKRKFLGALAKSTGGEAATEAFQEAVQEAAQAYADPDYKFDADEFRERLINAAIAGAVGGSQFGGASATIDTYRQSGINKRLNDYVEYESKLKQAASAGDQTALDKFNAELSEDYKIDTDLLTLAPLESENSDLKDLIDYQSARDAGGEGPVAALITYQEASSLQWMTARVRGESIESITEEVQQQGIRNAKITPLSDPLRSTTPEQRAKIEEARAAGLAEPKAENIDNSEPTEEEIEAAKKSLRKDSIKLEDFSEEDQDAIIQSAIEDARERITIGEVPTAPKATREDILESMREEIAAVEAAQDLTPEEKQAEKLEIELSVTEELDAMGEEFVSDDETNRGIREIAQDDGTNTPLVATENGKVTASPVVPDTIDPAVNPDIGIPISEQVAPPALDETYSDLEYIPAESLAGLSLEDNLAAGRTDFDHEGNRVKGGRKAEGEKSKSNNKFTRRAVALQNTVTGEVEIRGAYSAGLTGKKGDADRVQNIQLHGDGSSKRSGINLTDAINGWNADDYKTGQATNRKTSRPPHRVLGIIEFAGRPAPYDAEDQAFFDELKDRQRKGGKIEAADLARISGIADRSGGYGNIYATLPSEAALIEQVGARFVDPKETQAEKVARGKIQIYKPGEYLENLESVSTKEADEDTANESANDTRSSLLGDDDALDDAAAEAAEAAAFDLSDGDMELIDPEGLLTDEPTIDTVQAERDLKRKHGITAPELDTIFEELESASEIQVGEEWVAQPVTLLDTAKIFIPDGRGFKDYPAWSAFLSGETDEMWKLHVGASFELITKLHNARIANTKSNSQGSDQGAQAPVQDLQQSQREPQRAQGEDTGTTPAVSRQTSDGAAELSQREPGGSGVDPQGDRSRREQALDWSRIGDGHVAYAGDFVFSVEGGPKKWDLRIDKVDDDTSLYSEIFVGDFDQAVATVEAQILAKLSAKPAATNASPSVERQTSSAQPDRKTPDDKPKLVVIQGDRIPEVSDRVGEGKYDLDAVGKQGVNLALNAHKNGRSGFLNSDGTGVGKSRQAIVVMNEIQRDTGGRVLYVTENVPQIAKFKREMAALGVTNPQIEFTTYTQIGTGKLSGRKFAATVFDEAHNLKNATSAKSLGSANLKSDFTMFMTATPMDKPEAAAYFISAITGVDEDTILQRIGLERIVNERKDGSYYYTIQKQGGVTNGEIRLRLKELTNQLISEGAMIRREYPFYGARDVINVDLNEQQVATLDEINGYWDTQERDSGRNQDISRWLEAQKADEVYQRAKDDLANGRSVVVVAETVNAQWVQALEGGTKKDAGGKSATASRPQKGLVEILEARFKADGIATSSIHGNNAKDKSAAIDAFQSGENKVAIMTPKSGGAGIDLDDQHGNAPRSVYVATMNFSGDVFEQVMGRFSRRNTMSPTKLSFVTAPEASSETHRAAVLKEKLETLGTGQGKATEDQDSEVRDLFSDAVLKAPAMPAFPVDFDAAPIRTFNYTILPESRINTIEGIDYEIARATAPSPFLIDHHIDTIAKEFGADAGARTLIRNILEALPSEKLQTLDLRIVDDPNMSAGEYDVSRRMLTLNKAASLNQGNGIALAFTHEMGHFFVNEVIGFDFVKDQWQSLNNKQRAAAWKQYLDAQGVKAGKLDGAALVSNDTAAQEWASFQFTRVASSGVRNRDTLTKQMRKEGMSKSIIDTLTSWYDQLRTWINQWIGDADLSTTQLDQAVSNALGIETDPESMKADAKRQEEFLKTKAAEAGYGSIEEFTIEDVQGYGAAARKYRESKSITHLNSPDAPLQAPAGHRNPDIRKKLKGVDEARTSALLPETDGREAVGKKIVAENAWATHSELKDIAAPIYDQMRKQKLYAGDFDSFYVKFTATPITPREARIYLGALDVGIADVKRSGLAEDQQRNVDDYLLSELYETRKKLNGRLSEDTKNIRAWESEIKREEARLEKHQTNYNNAEALERGAVDELKKYLSGFKKALGSHGGVAKLGKLGEVIRQLEGQQEIDNRIARKYTIGIERLIASEEPFVLFDLLESVAESELDLSGRADIVRNRFADAGISMIASLSDEKFAAILSIAKADKHLLDTIILRKLPDIEEKIAIVESEVAETKGDFKRSAKAISKIKKHAALKGRIAGERALAKGRISRLKSKIKNSKQDQQISSAAFEVYDSEFNKVAGRVGGTVQGHVNDGTNLFVPKGTDATKGEILGSLKIFRYGETTSDDITRIMAAQREWLEGPSAEENRVADPVFYNQVKTQSARLMERTFKEVHTKGKSLSNRLYFDSLSNSFSKLDLPGGRAISQMLQKIEARTSAWNNKAATIGEQADKSRYLLGRALKLDKTPNIFIRRFADLVDTPMKAHMEQPGASIHTFISNNFPDASSEVSTLIERYYEAELKNSKFIREVTELSMQQAGLGAVTNDRILVPDYANDGKLTPIEQTHRNLGTGTFLIRPNMDTIGAIVDKFGSADKIGQVVRALSKEESELDSSDANALVDQLFADPDSFDGIIGAIARKEKVPVFSNANGDLVTREDSTEAFNTAKSPSHFFEQLYAEEGVAGGMDYNTYLAEQLAEVHRLYADIAKTEQQYKESQESPTSMSGHVAIDARKKDAWPSEWLSYRQGGVTANNIIVSQNVIASIFGKNGERINKEKASIMGTLRKKKLDAERSGDLALKEKRADEEKRAERYFKQLDNVLGSELGPLRDLKMSMEIMNTLVGGVLNGPRSAMVQLNQIYQPILHFGISGTTFRIMKSQAKTAAQDLFGSFFEAIGITIDRDNEAFNMQKDLYGLEPEKTNGYLGFIGGMGNEGGIGSSQRKLRLLNTMMSRRGISKAKAEEALYTSFKPWAPFSQLIGALGKAPMVAFRAEFDRLAGLAIKHADKALPNGGDLTKVNFNHKTMGFRSKVEFERLNNILQEQVGTTLADVVARYRANKGGPAFTRDQYITMSSVGLDQMASEANVFTTRSPQMHTEMGRFVFPLLGWSIHQPHHAFKMFKGAEGEVTKRTIGAGLITLSFGLVPAVMAMAMFEDWFDEEIMGKKRNLRPLSGAGPLGTANAVLERVTRNGMLGMPMEFVNLGMNIGGEGDLRTASLDQRVFLAGTIRGMIQIVGSVAHQRTLEGQKRRILQSIGANGYLQQLDMFSELLGLDNSESRIVARINANNYLRVGGRMIGLESRAFTGGRAPTPVTPWVTRMQIAAQSNDSEMFQGAYERAVKAARQHLGKTGPLEAEDYIAQNWNSRHPLKGPFRSPPTPGEYQQLLAAIGENGANDVRQMVSQYNLFGTRIGAKPYLGKTQRSSSSRTSSTSNMTGIIRY